MNDLSLNHGIGGSNREGCSGMRKEKVIEFKTHNERVKYTCETVDGVAKLNGVDLCGVNMEFFYLRSVEAVGTYFSGSNLCGAILAEGCLKEANFQGVMAIEINLSEADLSNSVFCKSLVTKADFSDANMAACDFSECNAQETKFENANVEFANFGETDLRGADFRVKEIRTANLKGAEYNADTLFPDDFDPEKAGMVFNGKKL